MGLEGVELVEACELKFGITIDDDEAAGCRTVGQLQDLVVSRLSPEGGVQYEEYVLERLRTALAVAADVGVGSVGPDTQLRELLEEPVDPDRWRAVSVDADLRLPSLVWAPWRALALSAGLVPSFAGLIYVVWWRLTGPPDPGWAFWPVSVAGILTLLVLARLDPHLSTHYPAGLGTVSDLATSAIALNFEELLADLGPPSEEQIREIVRDLVHDALGVDRERIVPEADFVRDLGMS